MRPIPYDVVFQIISHVDPCDATTLHACSLTHSSWTLDAQRRRFHTVEIRNREDMRRWDEFEEKDRLIPYVRHLIYSGDKGNPLGPRDFFEAYGGQFQSFENLHTLEMRHMALGSFDLDLFRLAFGHLGKTLQALLLSDATLTLNKFLELLTIFPRLQSLGLDRFTISREYLQFPSELPLFRGTLNLSGPVNKYSLRFIEDLTRTLPNFSSVRLRLNLGYQATRYLLEIPGLANHVTTMLLGYQDGEPGLLLGISRNETNCGADVPEIVDLSLCRNLRMLSIRTQGCTDRAVTSLAIQERFFQQLKSIISRELEFLVVEMGPGLSLMRYSAWGHFFSALSVLQASSERLSVVVRPFERFMAEKFKKGETLSRFLGVDIRMSRSRVVC